MDYNPPYGSVDPNASFDDHVPEEGIEGSVVPAKAIEDPQREIVAVIQAAGLDPSAEDLTQLRQAIAAMIAASIPDADASLKPGDLVFTARRVAPDGSLKANGAAVPIASYADLAAAIYFGDALNALAPWGYRCTNPANPTATRSVAGTHIVLPDLRGEWIRGWDDSRGIDVQVLTGNTTNGSAAITAIADTQTLYVGQSISGAGIPGGATIAAITSATAITISVAATATATGVSLTCIGRAFGSWQGDAIRNITGGSLNSSSGRSDRVLTHGDTFTNGAFGFADLNSNRVAQGSGTGIGSLSFDASRVVPTAPENRVRNTALLICIKY